MTLNQFLQVRQERVAALRARFSAWDVEGVLITSSTNLRWLSGFSGSNGRLLITATKMLLATDFRYFEQAARQAPAFELFKDKRRKEDTAALLETAAVKRVGLEANFVTLAQAKILYALENIMWVQLNETVESLRSVKTPAEITAIKRAAAITDQTIATFPGLARPGVSEKALAWELEKFMREAGADSMAFDIIVASGPNSALPHHIPGERELKAGDVIIVDLGATVDAYCSDLTRTFFLGSNAPQQFWSIYNLVKAAKTAVLDKTRAGMSSKAVDAIARETISAAGYADNFGHGLGHGVGLDIHETPFLSQIFQEVTLQNNMVITVEPGVYLPGWGGIRLEDLALLTPGGLQCFSQAPHIPIIPLK